LFQVVSVGKGRCTNRVLAPQARFHWSEHFHRVCAFALALLGFIAFCVPGYDYGVDGGIATFPATNCVVVDAHRQVNCTTTEGAGADISWILAIGNQTSQSPVTSYGYAGGLVKALGLPLMHASSILVGYV
jgi:hypothetical protein